jgi:hypothetical protein
MCIICPNDELGAYHFSMATSYVYNFSLMTSYAYNFSD